MEEIRLDLKKISTYARDVRKSTTWVYQQAKDKKLTIVNIDGIKFVKVA